MNNMAVFYHPIVQADKKKFCTVSVSAHECHEKKKQMRMHISVVDLIQSSGHTYHHVMTDEEADQQQEEFFSVTVKA